MRTVNKRWPLVTVAALVLGTLGPAVASGQAAVAAPVVTAAPAAGVQWPDRIEQGEKLLAGEQLVSRNGQYRLVLTPKGAAEIRTPRGGALWRTKAAGAGAYLTVKADGKLVLYTRAGKPVWYTAVRGADSVAVMQDTGHLVQYLGDDAAWHTKPKAWGPDLDFPEVAGSAAVGAAKPSPAVQPAAVVQPAKSQPAPVAAAATPGKRSASLHPFASSSVWNSAIGSDAKFQGRYDARTKSFLSGKPVINRTNWSIAVKRAKSSDPMAKLTGVRNRQSWTMRIPANTMPTGGSDGHVTIIAQDGVTAYDAYKLRKNSNSSYTAALVVVTDLRTSGLVSGVRAAGVPAIAGLIRAHELESANIPHALAVAIPGKMLKKGHIWPANRQDTNASSYTGAVPMGTLLAIPGSVNIDSLGLGREGKALAKALQNYGAYVVDRSGMVSLYCELDCNGQKTKAMSTDWKKLYPLMRAVTNNSPSSVGGGGTPRVGDPAPPR
jgi:hypothetical protein